ncbi:MAG: hypothetical protein HY721_16735 [Planctomycetes bacterium]|nr:hypothetical protein [Planctomycetota bacterium]
MPSARFLGVFAVFAIAGGLSRTTFAEPRVLELGEAAGGPGEVVHVPVYGTYELPLGLLGAAFRYDASRLQFLRYSVEGSAAEGADPVAILYRTFQPGEGIFGIHSERQSTLAFRVPPGERQRLGRLSFLIGAAASTGSASVAPVRQVDGANLRTAFFLDTGDSALTSFEPDSLLPGKVTVLAPAGPRPVGDLRCEQFLDRVLLSFTLTEAYDEVEVLRDGAPIATLPGSATGFTDPLENTAVIAYAVIARRGGAASVAARCEVVAVSPAAPAVRDLRCGDDGLTWVNPVTYDSIAVLRNGVLIAKLPGSSVAFRDPERPDALTVYTVLGELEGFRSPESNCLDHAIWIMEVGDVQVPAGADRFLVPIYATTTMRLENFDAHLRIDLSRLEYLLDLDAAIDGTVLHPEPEVFRMGIGILGLPSVGIIFDVLPPVQDEKLLSPGLRQLIFHFPFRIRGSFAEGETLPVSVEQGSFGIDPGTGVTSVQPDLFLAGQVRFGSGGPPPVKNLRAKPGGAGGGAGAGPGRGEKDVAVTWENGSRYETVRILRNGGLVGEIQGGSTSYVDAGVRSGLYTYKVVGLAGGRESFPASIFLSTVSPPGTFLRGDSTRDGRIDVSDPIATLNYLFLGGIPDAGEFLGRVLRCEDAADADDDGVLGISDPILTLTFLFLGGRPLRAPGTTYPWFDPTLDGLQCRG